MPSDCMGNACACDCNVRVITPKEIQKKFDKLEAEIRRVVAENEELRKKIKKYGYLDEIVAEVEKRKIKRPRKG